MSAISEKISLDPGVHAVHFYEDVDDLSGIVAAHLCDGLADGGAAVAIATQPHIESFQQRLACRGVDIEAARACGALIVRDAAQTLSEITVGDEIDEEAFRRIVGGVLREAGQHGRAIRAYGEMVDLLWQAGEIDAAIELEKLWNELIDERQFSLLCAYHSEAAAAPEHRHALGEVCRLHSSVSPATVPDERTRREVSREFEPDPDAPRAARRFVEEALERWGRSDDRLVDDARLLLSELVTNAVTHARSPFSVTIHPHGSGVRLAVRDQSPAEPALRPIALEADSGRGIQIVDALSRDWGVVATPVGKTVWAEL